MERRNVGSLEKRLWKIRYGDGECWFEDWFV